MHSDQGLFAIAWCDQGVRVIDVSGFADLPTPAVPFVASGSSNGIKEIGRYAFDDANTWSFKTQRIASDGSFFGFGNDLGRGLDVYRFNGLGRTVPVLEPTDLKPVADVALLLLVGLAALTGTAAVARRPRRTGGLAA